MKILLVAPPGTGKSTILDKVFRALQGPKFGIIAHQILDHTGKHTGFTASNATGQSRQFMHLTDKATESTIGDEFDVDIEAIDQFIVPELQKGLAAAGSGTIVFIDEIGRAQARSPKFIEVLTELFDSQCDVLGSIACEDEDWSLIFKYHPTVSLLHVTEDNRDELPGILIEAASQRHLDSSSQIQALSHLGPLQMLHET